MADDNFFIGTVLKPLLYGAAEGGAISVVADWLGVSVPSNGVTFLAVVIVILTSFFFLSPSSGRSADSSKEQMLQKNVSLMDGGNVGFDVVIICCNTAMMAEVLIYQP